MIWNKFRIYHSQKNFIDLYCRQENEKLEINITDGSDNPVVLVRDFLMGNINDLVLDQYSNSIEWESTKFDFEKYVPNFDNAAARKRHGYLDSIDYLKHHIANSINLTHKNRSFSRFVKKHIIGTWASNGFNLEFNNDKSYILRGKSELPTMLYGIPEEGNYFISRNSILFWGNNNSGFRTQVVDLIKDKIFLPGFSGKLFYILEKIT